MSEGFFSRWSQRKQAAQNGQPLAQAPADTEQALRSPPRASAAPADAPPQTALPSGPVSSAPTPIPTSTDVPASAEPLPTLNDAQQLTSASDFQPFMRQGVPGEVRNLAMKKLFADPHFNVMDGLDIYIGDYTQPDPLPEGMLQKMVGAQYLKLVPSEDDAPADKTPDPDWPATGTVPVVAQSPDSAASTAALEAAPSAHDDPDLQLQPNHAPASPDPGQSTG